FMSGDAWVYLVIAHEWGHAIQARLSRALGSRQAELQADCFAGAVLYGAHNDGTLQFEQGDEKEIANALARIADDTPWTKQGDHGDPFQRIQAFGTGRSGGVMACLPIS
ncbi:MAG: neutral zinc metallopeptidase, partial [Stenotrophomonas sp.]